MAITAEKQQLISINIGRVRQNFQVTNTETLQLNKLIICEHCRYPSTMTSYCSTITKLSSFTSSIFFLILCILLLTSSLSRISVVQASEDSKGHREPRYYGLSNSGRVYEAVEEGFMVGGPISTLEKRDTQQQQQQVSAAEMQDAAASASIAKRILLRQYQLGNDFR